MQKGILILVAAVIVVVVVAACFLLLGNDETNDDPDGGSYTDGVVVDIVTDDPDRETAEGGGRLWIMGNANMDDVLDEDDVEWIEKIIAGTANEIVFNAGLSDYSVDVRMADANNDGVIDYQDIEKVRSLIEMTEDSEKQELYYVDVDGAISLAHVPILTTISTYIQNTKQLQTIDALDTVIGVDYQSYEQHVWTQDQLSEDLIIFWSTSERMDPDAELIMSINPDAILTGNRDSYCQTLEAALPSDRTSMDLIRISSWEDNNVLTGTLTLGFMMCKYDEALDYVEWADYWLDLIEERVSTLSEDEIVNVLVPRGQYSNWNVYMNAPRSGKYETSVMAGANNIITRNLTSTDSNVTVTDEWVKSQSDLDFIVCIVYGDLSNNETNGFTNRSFYETAVEYWSDMTAAYGTEVHVLDNLVSQGTTFIIGVVYMAKWFYPELFEDMDPDAIFQEFMDEFLRYDFDVAAYQATGGIAI